MEQEQTWRWAGLGILVLVLILIAYAVFAGAGNPLPPNTAATTATSTTATETAATTDAGGNSGAEQSAPAARSGKAPLVKTIGFAGVSSTTALVIGTVSPEGAETTYWFEYGPSLNFGSTIDARSAGAGALELGAAGYLANLKPGTEYYFRIGAQNAYGRSYGAPYKLITAAK